MIQFDAKTQLVVDDDVVRAVDTLLQKEGAKDVALILDESVASLRAVGRLQDLLKARGTLYSKSYRSQEPTTDIVDEFTDVFRGKTIDLFIGIGGGSTLDLTKAVSVMVDQPGKVTDYHGTGKSTVGGKRKILVPTTAGTGSEVTPGAVLTNTHTQFKRALSGRNVCADYAVLDANLTVSLPDAVTAATGMDALTHAIESYTAQCANTVTRMYSRQAFTLIWNNLPQIFSNPKDFELRRRVLLGSALAGYAIYNCNTGAAHSLGYALGIYHHVPHGVAVGLLIPRVVQINIEKGCTLYADLFDLMEDAPKNLLDAKAKARAFCESLQRFPALKNIRWDAKSAEIGPDRIDFLAERGLDLKSALNNNPVAFEKSDALRALNEMVLGTPALVSR